jgi:hypothetical protein
MIDSQVSTTPAKQLLFVLVISTGASFLFGSPAFAGNSKNEPQISPRSNETANLGDKDNGWHGGIYFGPENTSIVPSVTPVIVPENPVPVDSTSEAKKVEPVNPNYLYGALDFGSNVVYATNGSLVATSSSGLQITGKVGYSMSGPRVELESSVGTLASGVASFNGTGINAYYDFQTGSTRPYIGVGYGFGSINTSAGRGSEAIVQSKIGVSFESTPGNNFYIELRGVQPISTDRAGIASFNIGNTLRF